jgi:hypothetical protein
MNDSESIKTEPHSLEGLQKEKLKLEIRDLKHKKTLEYKVVQLLPLFTIVIAIGGLWWNIRQFNIAQIVQARNEKASSEREFRKPFWSKQIELYFDATSTAAMIATLPEDSQDRKKATERFWQLYYGPLVSVEDESVMKAKVAFGKCLDEIDIECESPSVRANKLKALSLDLANSCRSSVGKNWDVELNNLYMQEPPTARALP